MNTGVDDTANLAWKLAALYMGWGGPRLLANYEEETLPIAIRNLAQSYALAEIKSAINVPEGLEGTALAAPQNAAPMVRGSCPI